MNLLEIDLTVPVSLANPVTTEPSKELKVTSIGSGNVHAIVYWYKLHFGTTEICSRNINNNWNQAAFIIKKPFKIEKNESLMLNSTFAHGFVRMKLNRVPLN